MVDVHHGMCSVETEYVIDDSLFTCDVGYFSATFSSMNLKNFVSHQVECRLKFMNINSIYFQQRLKHYDVNVTFRFKVDYTLTPPPQLAA